MHRVNTKKRRAALLRVVTYSTTLILTIITTAALLYLAQGYGFDRRSGHVVRSGLVLVDNRPQAAQVYVNGELKDGSAPSRFVLPAGDYELSLERESYRGWKKQISVEASGVEEVYYPILVPTNLTTQPLLALDAPQLVSQSLDRKLVLLHNPGQNQLQLLELNPEKPTLTALPLPPALPRENGSVGNLEVIEWALNNKHVLLRQTLPSGTVQLLSFDVTKPAEAINISSLYGGQTPADIHYKGGQTEVIYGLKDGLLSTYDLGSQRQVPLLGQLQAYQPYGDNTILFTRTSETPGEVESGIWQDETATVVHRAPQPPGQTLLGYREYEGHFYFAVAQTSGERVTIYRDPLKKPILATQLPYATLPAPQPSKLSFSDNGQFLAAHHGQAISSYDFENLQSFQFSLPFPLSPAGVRWLDSHHLTAQQTDGLAYLLDYDGTNLQALTGGQPNLPSLFSDNLQYLYRLTDSAGQSQLSLTNLVANQN